MASAAVGILGANPTAASAFAGVSNNSKPKKLGLGLGLGTAVECSSRPQKKATSHHMKTRPKKTQPWDVKRKGPTPYPPLPPLPSDWTLLPAPAPEPEPQPVAIAPPPSA